MYVENYEAPFGNLILNCSELGLTRVSVGKVAVEKNHPLLRLAKEELNQYFRGERQSFSVPLDIQGTEFQKKTWTCLQKIPLGCIISYKELAQKVATSKHCRAVANANNKNKLPIFIPCHRVVGSDRSLVGFAWGVEVKRELLRNEGVGGFPTPSTHKRENTFIK